MKTETKVKISRRPDSERATINLLALAAAVFLVGLFHAFVHFVTRFDN